MIVRSSARASSTARRGRGPPERAGQPRGKAVEQGDEAGFRELWNQMLEIVAADGNGLADDELVESDVIMPPRDVTFEEARGSSPARV